MVKFSSLFIVSFSTALTLSTSVLAATHFLPEYEDKWGSFSSGIKNSIPNRVKDEQNRCFAAGYKITSCPEGFAAKISERCPYSLDKNYYKKCYSHASVCIENGYTASCGDGYVVDTSRTCPQDSSYTKCKASDCAGYGYSEAEANAEGYVIDGEPCQSGTTKKYKRKPNPCTGYGYDSSNCGVSSCATLSGETCLSGTVTKYKTCQACPPPSIECGAGEVDLDTYWCNGALRCWWKAGITACTPTNSCSNYNLTSQSGCEHGYDPCDDGCGKIRYKCSTCTATRDCSAYNLISQSGCSDGYDACDDGCGNKSYKCKVCTPTTGCAGYTHDSSDDCPIGGDECDNGCGTKKYKCKLYKVGDNYFMNGVQAGKVIAVSGNAVTVASVPQISKQEIADYCIQTQGWFAPNANQGQKIMSAFNLNGVFDTLRIGNPDSYNYCVYPGGMTFSKGYCVGSYYNSYNSCILTVQQIKE